MKYLFFTSRAQSYVAAAALLSLGLLGLAPHSAPRSQDHIVADAQLDPRPISVDDTSWGG
ncbi:hypothetical protein GCM10010254_64250 [Streptomyces chromofuscus]|nr:hypothetical protein GCM10010254_64250 [Streptomyces chromofuscus]